MNGLFSSRKFWITVGAIAICLTLVLTLGPDKASQAVTTTALLSGTLVAAIAYEDGKEKGAPQTTVATNSNATAETPSAQSTNAEKKTIFTNTNSLGALLGVLCVSAVAFSGGCAPLTPTTQPTTQLSTQQQINQIALDNVQRGFDDASLGLDLAYGLGAISLDDYNAVQAMEPAVQKAINLARDEINTGDFRTQLAKASKALVDYRMKRDAAKTAKAAKAK